MENFHHTPIATRLRAKIQTPLQRFFATVCCTTCCTINPQQVELQVEFCLEQTGKMYHKRPMLRTVT